MISIKYMPPLLILLLSLVSAVKLQIVCILVKKKKKVQALVWLYIILSEQVVFVKCCLMLTK